MRQSEDLQLVDKWFLVHNVQHGRHQASRAYIFGRNTLLGPARSSESTSITGRQGTIRNANGHDLEMSCHIMFNYRLRFWYVERHRTRSRGINPSTCLHGTETTAHRRAGEMVSCGSRSTPETLATQTHELTLPLIVPRIVLFQ